MDYLNCPFLKGADRMNLLHKCKCQSGGDIQHDESYNTNFSWLPVRNKRPLKYQN